MKRYTAYDAQEYVNWSPDPEIQAAYAALASSGSEVLSSGPWRRSTPRPLSRPRDGTLARYPIEEMGETGVITKAWLGSGEEAVTIGSCAPLRDGDVVGPMIRNASALIQICRCSPIFIYLGTLDNLTGGRDLHIGDLTYKCFDSHIGDLVPVMSGCALAFKQKTPTPSL